MNAIRPLLFGILTIFAFGTGTSPARADDDWEDRREELEERREEARERWEDYQEERQERWEDYQDDLEDRYEEGNYRDRYRGPYTTRYHRPYGYRPHVVYPEPRRYYDDEYYDRYDDGTVYYSAPRRHYHDQYYYTPRTTYYGTPRYGYYETPYGREGVRVGPFRFEWWD